VSAYGSTGPGSAQTTLIRQPPPPVGRGGKADRRRPAPAGAKAAGPPRRPRRWIGLLALLVALVVVSGVVWALVVNNRDQAGGVPDPGPSTGNPSPSSERPRAVPIEDVRDFDPQADPPAENPQLVKYAHDGSTKTRWQTVKYLRNPKLGGLKRGVGLVVDLGAPTAVSSVKVSLSGSGTAVQLRIPKEDPEDTTEPPMSSDARWTTVDKDSDAQKSATLTPEDKVTTRFLLVYLTSLPREGSGYRGGIYEVEVYS
jgi:putative peptidoglycan lipid II flippase